MIASAQESSTGEKAENLLKARKEQVEIRVDNHLHDQIYMWTKEKFYERLIVMRDLLSTYEDSGSLP